MYKMEKTKEKIKKEKKTKRSEEYLIHLQQSLYYRRRCRATYALFKELREKKLLNVDEPFRQQIEDLFIEEESEAVKKDFEKREKIWLNHFQNYCEYVKINPGIIKQTKKTNIVSNDSNENLESSIKYNKSWIIAQRTDFSHKKISEHRLQKLRTIDEWNTWEQAFQAKIRLSQIK